MARIELVKVGKTLTGGAARRTPEGGGWGAKAFPLLLARGLADALSGSAPSFRIAVMNEGRIEQVGSAQEIHEEPRSVFAAEFFNLDPDTPSINLIDGDRVSDELSPYLIGARPAQIAVGGAGALALRGEVVDARPLPLRRQSVLCVRAAGSDIYLKVDDPPVGGGGARYRRGATLDIALSRYHLFDKASGLRIKSLGRKEP